MLNTSLSNIKQSLDFVDLVAFAAQKNVKDVLEAFKAEREVLDSEFAKVASSQAEAREKLKEAEFSLEQAEALKESYEAQITEAELKLEKARKTLSFAEETRGLVTQEKREFEAEKTNIKEAGDLLNSSLKTVRLKEETLDKKISEANKLKTEYEEKLNKLRNVVG